LSIDRFGFDLKAFFIKVIKIIIESEEFRLRLEVKLFVCCYSLQKAGAMENFEDDEDHENVSPNVRPPHFQTKLPVRKSVGAPGRKSVGSVRAKEVKRSSLGMIDSHMRGGKLSEYKTQLIEEVTNTHLNN
jgi:hypothetical protein